MSSHALAVCDQVCSARGFKETGHFSDFDAHKIQVSSSSGTIRRTVVFAPLLHTTSAQIIFLKDSFVLKPPLLPRRCTNSYQLARVARHILGVSQSHMVSCTLTIVSKLLPRTCNVFGPTVRTDLSSATSSEGHAVYRFAGCRPYLVCEASGCAPIRYPRG
jgi:hypothetical protein